MYQILYILIFLLLSNCNQNNSKSITYINSLKDSCSIESSFDEHLFNYYYVQDTSNISKKILNRFHNVSLMVFNDSLDILTRDGVGDRIEILKYAIKKNIPKSFKIYAFLIQQKNCKKAFLYAKKALRLDSCSGFDYFSSIYENSKQYKKCVELDSIDSNCGNSEATYRLYLVFSDGQRLWHNSEKEYIKFIHQEKAKYYFQKALNQKNGYALYQYVLDAKKYDKVSFDMLLIAWRYFLKQGNVVYQVKVENLMNEKFKKFWREYLNYFKFVKK